MKKIIESKKLEYVFWGMFMVSIALSFLSTPLQYIPLRVVTVILILLYFLRIFVSLSYFKFSRGIAVINALLNIQIMVCAEMIGLFFYREGGGFANKTMLAMVNTGGEVFLFLIVSFLLIRGYGVNKLVYWQHLKANFIKAVVATAICNGLMFINF